MKRKIDRKLEIHNLFLTGFKSSSVCFTFYTSTLTYEKSTSNDIHPYDNIEKNFHHYVILHSNSIQESVITDLIFTLS